MKDKTRDKFFKLFAGNYKVLLVSLFLLFIFRPYGRTSWYLPFWKLLLTATLLLAVFNCNHRKPIRVICFVLAFPAVIFSWLNVFHPSAPVIITNALTTVSFMTLCTCSILFDVVLRAQVTLETLRGVICAYFMVAFAFAYAYYLIEYLFPGTFLMLRNSVPHSAYTEYISEMIYFSFVTLLTIGYGDITAIQDIGQTVVILEGIIGQFYIAILVARIVSVYSFISYGELLQKKTDES